MKISAGCQSRPSGAEGHHLPPLVVCLFACLLAGILERGSALSIAPIALHRQACYLAHRERFGAEPVSRVICVKYKSLARIRSSYLVRGKYVQTPTLSLCRDVLKRPGTFVGANKQEGICMSDSKSKDEALDLTYEYKKRGMSLSVGISGNSDEVITVYRDDESGLELFELGNVRDALAFLGGWDAREEVAMLDEQLKAKGS